MRMLSDSKGTQTDFHADNYETGSCGLLSYGLQLYKCPVTAKQEQECCVFLLPSTRIQVEMKTERRRNLIILLTVEFRGQSRKEEPRNLIWCP